MKAITFNRLGPPDVLQLTELPVPFAGPGTVRVRVQTAGVMPIDAKVRSGSVPYAQSHPFPIIPGNEFAGIIDEVGDGVSEFVRGDEVIGFTMFGGYAEYVVVSSDQLVRKPAGMP